MVWNQTIVPDSSCVFVKTPEELKATYRAALAMYGYSDGLDTSEADSQIDHENAHAKGVENDTIFGIKLFRQVETRGQEESGRIVFYPFVYTSYIGPKIGWAALTARPLHPSSRDTKGTDAGDINNLQTMGYTGVDDVVQRTIEWNRKHPERQFLLPESHEAARDAEGAGTLSEIPMEKAAPQSEQQTAQVDAAVSFARYLTTRYPQVDDSPQVIMEVNPGEHIEVPNVPDSLQVLPELNYYLAGSLATTLLSRAETIDICEETNGSNITVVGTLQNPPETRAILAEFARPIGDIDYVPTAHYKDQWTSVRRSYGKASDDEYRQRRAKLLGKGGGGPTFGDLPDDALAAVKMTPKQSENKDKHGVMCDPVEPSGTKKFARIAIGGEEYYIARPDTIVAYKILHMLKRYEGKPDAFNTDFAKLYQAMSGLYSEEELIAVTHDTLREYEEKMLNMAATFDISHEPELPSHTQKLLAQPTLGTEARAFMGKLVEYDQHHGQILGAQIN